MGEKGQIALRHPQHVGGRGGFAAGDDQPARDVVGAVAVLAAHGGVAGMFKQSRVVGQPAQMCEAGRRRHHAAATAGRWLTRSWWAKAP